MRLLALLLVPLTAMAQPDARTARLDSVLTALHAAGLFEGAIAIDEEAAVAFRYEAGELASSTPLYLASVSKMMTAAAVLTLAEEGRLGLDDPVGRHLSPWPYPDLTVRHLLAQTSGLHVLGMVTAERDTSRLVTTADLLALIAEHRPPLQFEPGTAFAYSNANFAALAALLETVDGRPYEEAMRARVFEPAGMDTAFVAHPGEVPWIAWSGGDGDAVHASVEEMLAFDRAWTRGEIVSPDLVRLAETPVTLADGTLSPYGLGRFLTDDPRPLVGHFGDGLFAKSGLWRDRRTGTTYGILMPGDAIHRTAILTAVMAIWNSEPFTLPQVRPVADVPEAVLAEHVGVYASGFGRLHITLEDGGLHLEPEGAGGSEPLIPASGTVFYFGHQDLSWEFVRDEEGRTVGLQLQGQPETLAAREE